MVARAPGRRGSTTLGCVVSLVLFLAAAYYGVHIGEVYLRFYRLDRTGRRITIQTEYSDSVDLPFFKHTFLFRPRAEAPL